MDLSAIIVILVLSALSLAAIVWMEMHSRERKRAEASDIKATARMTSRARAGSVLKKEAQDA